MSSPGPIVLVPGFIGSRLARATDGRIVWVDLGWDLGNLTTLTNLLNLQLPPDHRLTPVGALNTIPFSGVLHFDVYGRLRRWATANSSWGLGLCATDYHEFGYDWRKSIGEAASGLNALLVSIAKTPMTVIAHSQGGLVVAALFALNLPGAQRIGKLVAIGCPFAGLLKTIAMIQNGSGILDQILSHDPIRPLLRAMPASYELMPARKVPPLFLDDGGSPSTPGANTAAFPAQLYDANLLRAAAGIVGSLSLQFPVSLRLIEGFGTPTVIRAQVASGTGGFGLTTTFEGDGTCPAESLTAAGTNTVTNGSKDFATLSVPFAAHVPLVWQPEVLAFLKADLTGTSLPPQFFVSVAKRTAVANYPNLLVVETRNPDGSPFPLTANPTASILGTAVTLNPCRIAGRSRWIAEFLHPSGIAELTVNAPGLGSRTLLLA